MVGMLFLEGSLKIVSISVKAPLKMQAWNSPLYSQADLSY